MALLNTDYFVVQRPTDANKHYKLSGEKLKEFIAAGETISYKGSRDFRDNGQDPSLDGTGVQNGDLYINNNPVTGAGTWVANILGEDVEQGDRAIWNGGSNSWDLIKSDTGDHGVEEIIGIQPITVDNNVEESPQISVYNALTTADSIPAPRATRSGVVPSIAVASDVVANDGVASPNENSVVPASLLKASNDNIVEVETNIDGIEVIIGDGQGLTGSLTENITNINQEITNITEEIEEISNSTLASLKGEDPIEVTTELLDDTAVDGDADFGKTETTVSIKDGTTVQKGAVQLQENGSAKSASITTAATPGYVDTYYLVKDFSTFGDA
jgi:hypothetical protein